MISNWKSPRDWGGSLVGQSELEDILCKHYMENMGRLPYKALMTEALGLP